MVGKKKTASKPASKASAVKKPLSDKDQVLKIFKNSVCLPIKTGFVIFDQEEEGKALHSGLAKCESDAWKVAAHNLL